MINIDKRQRLFSFLMILGASVLLFRTLRMMFVEHAFDILAVWVIILLIIEFIVDLSCIVTSIRWLILNDRRVSGLPLRFGAAATILHFIRVLIYALGRTGLFLNFDIKPTMRETYSFSWFWVYFALILGVLGVLGMVVIWKIIRNYQSQH